MRRRDRIRLVDILRTALQAHKATNCGSDVPIADAEDWVRSINKAGFLLSRYDSCLGFSSMIETLKSTESALVRLLRSTGAVPFVKTTVPITQSV